MVEVSINCGRQNRSSNPGRKDVEGEFMLSRCPLRPYKHGVHARMPAVIYSRVPTRSRTSPEGSGTDFVDQTLLVCIIIVQKYQDVDAAIKLS